MFAIFKFHLKIDNNGRLFTITNTINLYSLFRIFAFNWFYSRAPFICDFCIPYISLLHVMPKSNGKWHWYLESNEIANNSWKKEKIIEVKTYSNNQTINAKTSLVITEWEPYISQLRSPWTIWVEKRSLRWWLIK